MHKRRSIAPLLILALILALLTPWLPVATPAAAAPPPDPPGRRLGAKPDTPEKLRGVPFHRAGTGAPGDPTGAAGTLAAQVDLSAGLPPVGDQEWQGSCVAWSIGYYYESFQQAREHGWSLATRDHQYSPAFIYNQINGGQDWGSSPSDAMTLLASKGAASWASMPYAASDYLTQPDPYQFQDALPYVTASWAYFQPGDVIGMKAHIAGGDPVSLTIPVYPNFDFPTSPCTTPIGLPPAGSTIRGWHQITLVGYDDALGAFKMANSWGAGWGCSGYAWLGYDFVGQHAGYGYSMAPKPDTLGILAGRVTNAANGAAVAGAEVTAGGYAINTDGNGDYTLAVPAGGQTVNVTAAGYAGWSQSVEVLAGQPRELAPVLTLASGASATVRGRVLDSVSGATIAGASVSIAGVSATSAADGSYSIGNLIAGSYLLSAAAQSYNSASQQVSLTAGATTVADTQLLPLPRLTGVVTDANSGAAIAGATVTLEQSSTKTDANGRYTLSGLTPGTHTLKVSATKYNTSSQTVSLTNGTTTTANAQLQPTPGYLAGFVKDSVTGVTIVGASVTLGQWSTQTDATGFYSFDTLPPGTYTEQISAPGYQTLQRSVTINWGTRLTIMDSLTPLPGTLVVKVVDAATGAQVRSATVKVGTLSGKTDGAGTFSGSLPAGPYTVTVSKTKYKTSTVQVMVVRGETTTVVVRMTP